MLTSNDPQTIIRTARVAHRCDCHLRQHHGGDDRGGFGCENVIQAGEQYPEYLGESPSFQSGTRYCPECRKDQLGNWISE